MYTIKKQRSKIVFAISTWKSSELFLLETDNCDIFIFENSIELW